MKIEVKEYVLRLVEQGHFEGYDVEEFEAYLMEEDECWISSGSSPSSSESSHLSDE